MTSPAHWKPIVAAIDGSRAAADAAAFARHLAGAAGTTCHVVHAAADPWLGAAATPRTDVILRYQEAAVAQARSDLRDRLHEAGVPPDEHHLTVRLGRPVRVVQQLVDELDAGLVVLGGKRHAALDRWLGGSTALNAVRALSVPVLVLRDPPPRPQRVLVAADASAAAAPTIAAAERFADLFGATLRVLSVVQPVPPVMEDSSFDAAAHAAAWEDTVRQEVWPLIRSERAQPLLRHGPVIDTIQGEAADWPADLLVVGSHGKGWVDRLLLGTTTESLLNRLPTSLLVVPAPGAVAAAARSAARAASALV